MYLGILATLLYIVSPLHLFRAGTLTGRSVNAWLPKLKITETVENFFLTFMNVLNISCYVVQAFITRLRIQHRQSKTWTGNAGQNYATSVIRFILNPVTSL